MDVRFVPFMFRISEQGTVPRLTSDQSTGSQTSGFIQCRRESDPFKKFQHSDLQSALLYQLGTNRKLQHGGEDWQLYDLTERVLCILQDCNLCYASQIYRGSCSNFQIANTMSSDQVHTEQTAQMSERHIFRLTGPKCGSVNHAYESILTHIQKKRIKIKEFQTNI
jgi:hypothetical protein